MDKSIQRYTSLAAMKAAEYRDWQALPARTRIQAISDMTLEAYAMKGQTPDVPRLQRIIVRLQRPQS